MSFVEDVVTDAEQFVDKLATDLFGGSSTAGRSVGSGTTGATLTDLRWDGMTNDQLAHVVSLLSQGPGAAAMTQAADALAGIAQSLQQIDQTLQQQLQAIGVSWQSDAADLAQEMTTASAAYGGSAGDNGNQAGSSVGTQGDAFSMAKNAAPSPGVLQGPSQTSPLDSVVHVLTGHVDDHAQQVAQTAAARQQTIDTLNGYAQTSQSSLNGYHPLPQPPAVGLSTTGVDPSIGQLTTVSGFPGSTPGGAGSTGGAGATVPGSGAGAPGRAGIAPVGGSSGAGGAGGAGAPGGGAGGLEPGFVGTPGLGSGSSGGLAAGGSAGSPGVGGVGGVPGSGGFPGGTGLPGGGGFPGGTGGGAPGGGAPGMPGGGSSGIGPGGSAAAGAAGPAESGAAGVAGSVFEDASIGTAIVGGSVAAGVAGAHAGQPPTDNKAITGPGDENSPAGRAASALAELDEEDAAAAGVASRIGGATGAVGPAVLEPIMGGQGGEDDGQHHNRYAADGDDMFGDSRLVTPAVLGGEPDEPTPGRLPTHRDPDTGPIAGAESDPTLDLG
ncbi:MAG TPA: hypothetical protein VHW44_15245 [Pseudonocardiaceae bacterium]|jgi:hypothetical protein|nr:hypothetical protein [Pseudonocardiaceae bacterium]